MGWFKFSNWGICENLKVVLLVLAYVRQAVHYITEESVTDEVDHRVILAANKEWS